MHEVLHALEHGILDGLYSLPILFIAYLLMELLEHSERLNENKILGYSRRTGPLLGSLLGIIPQCGISGAAASLFSTGSITVGTMLAVFFATSDEMLPIMLTALADSTISIGKIICIVGAKAGCAIVLGYIADLLLQKRILRSRDIHSFCEREHCSCDEEEGNVFISALKHTIRIGILIIVVNIVLHLLLDFIGTERICRLVAGMPVLSEIVIALFGLIPNCAISVVLTELYLQNVLTIGCLFAGLLSNAGIGLLVLLRNNKDPKENLMIVSVLFGLSAITGMLITLGGMLL